MKKQIKNRIITTGLMMALGISLLAGAGSTEAYAASRQNSNDTVGSILLSATPEIKISYNKRGNVTTLKGLNTEGRGLLTKDFSYKGDSCETVVKELIGRMDNEGYLDATTHNQRRNIILKLYKNSQLPADDFLDSVASAARKELTDRKLTSRVITVDADDYEPNYKDKEYINYETAKKIIKDQLNLNNIKFLEQDYDIDDGVYELEFTADGIEYECEILASTGKIIKVERDDDRYDDDRYDDDRYDDDRYDDDRYDDDRYDDDDDDDRYDDDDDDDDRYDD